MYQTTLEDIRLVIELNKPLNVIKLKIKEYFEAEQYNNWLEQKEQEYNKEYPEIDEKGDIVRYSDDINNFDEEGNYIIRKIDGTIEKTKSVKYKPSFEDWLASKNYIFVFNEEDIDLSKVKPLLKKAIKNEFLKSFNKGFTCSNGITMDCNMYDIDLLRKGLDLAVRLEQTEMLVRDFYNKTHSLPIEEVEKMLIELGLNWQRLWQKKVSLQEKVDSINSLTDLEDLRWDKA